MSDRSDDQSYGQPRSALAPERTEIDQLREEVRRLREEQDRLREKTEDSNKNAPAKKEDSEDKDGKGNGEKDEKQKEGRGFIREHPIKAIAGLLVLVAIVIGSIWYWQYTQTFESTDDAQVDGHLNAISSRVPGTITAVYIDENQQVSAGKLLVELDPGTYTVNLEQAQANLAQARAQVLAQQPTIPITATTTASGISGAESNFSGAQAGLAAAEHQLQSQLAKVNREEANNVKAQADLERYRELVKKDEISRQEYDSRVAAAKSAQASLESERAGAEAARRVVDQRRSQVALAQNQVQEATANAPRQVSAQRATLAIRRASVQAAEAGVAEAQLNLDYTKIFSPIAGIIGRKAAEIGMRVQPGQQLVSVVPLTDIWVTANFKETQLQHMKTGQSATIHVDAIDKDFEGYVDSMPAATAARYSLLPPENASGNFVKVVQRLPVRLRFKGPGNAHGALRPGMSVVPKVWLK